MPRPTPPRTLAQRLKALDAAATPESAETRSQDATRAARLAADLVTDLATNSTDTPDPSTSR